MSDFSERVFRRLTLGHSGDGGLSPAQAEAEPGNFLRLGGALAATKMADGLIDPKLVLAWLAAALGVPTAMTGMLVPLREAGALLPQMLTAPRIDRAARRKGIWALATAAQGGCVLGIAGAALALSGVQAGWAIVVLLTALAVARSVASVTVKPLTATVIGKRRRGTVSGLASSVAAGAVLLFALALMVAGDARRGVVIGALVVAGLLFLGAAVLGRGLYEEPVVRSGTVAPFWQQFGLLREVPALRRFIAVRGLLTGTALAPPFLVLMAGEAGGLGQLGALVLASALAALLSGFFWGRLSDRSSRQVIVFAGIAAASALVAALGLKAAGFYGGVVPAAVLFALMVAYHGVRTARATYLVDLAPDGERARYTAVANTVIGVLLLGSGSAGALAAQWGTAAALALFAGMAVAGAGLALGLPEVE